MPVPSSGELKLRADINQEINGNDTDVDVSLGTLSDDAGFSAPDTMSDFYGYSSNVNIVWNEGGLGNCFVTNNNMTDGAYTPGGSVSGQYYEVEVNSNYGFQNWSSVSVSGLPAGMTASVSNQGGGYGLGVGKIRITIGGVYPQTSQTINVSLSGGSVTAIHTVTTSFNIWPSGAGQNDYRAYSINVGSFGASMIAGYYETFPYNSSQSVKVWHGSTSVTVGYADAQIGEYWGSATGSANGTSGWSWSSSRQSNLYRHEIVATKNSGSITGNTSLSVTSWSSGGGGNNFGQRTSTQVSRTGASSGGNWACSNMSGQSITGIGYSTTSSGTTDPRGRIYGIAYTPHTNQNWAYSTSHNVYWFNMSFASGGTADIGTGMTNPDTCNSSSITCPT